MPGNLPSYVSDKVLGELLRALEVFVADDSAAFADLRLVAPDGREFSIFIATEPLSERIRTLAHTTEELGDADPRFVGGKIPKPQ